MTPSEKVYASLRTAVLRGEFQPRQALKPQELATAHGVSLAVAREALLRLVGEGLADRLPNRGFAVPAASAERWQQIAEARSIVEPGALRLSITRGDLEWEAAVRAAYHRLAGTPHFEREGDNHLSDAWSEAHRLFHRTLLSACGNDVLLETFDRLWTASELTRRWSLHGDPSRDAAAEHQALEDAALSRDGDRAAELLRRHVLRTAEALTNP
ncbi:GntR family transcriptional regulator [Paractinoplanes lichenicola]|uniref:GntR family transcriptional regulator n=1 Tax=Paractinoplanes lichenicola TaxID=2802976 RepID=UPI0027DD7D04|nr:GntR family transcriptional regulator [Actinoplanes lichenicola]